MPPPERDATNPVDVAIKQLFRRYPRTILRLAGVPSLPASLRWEDAAIVLAETRADQVLIVEQQEGGGALYLEYQLQPDSRVLPDWFLKCAGLTAQLKMPVSLLVVYLSRAGRNTFPDRYDVKVSGVPTGFYFTAVHLWEHREQIESGELIELAPLLLLCDDAPILETVRQEWRLIDRSSEPRAARRELFGLATRIAERSFPKAVLAALLREELPHMQETSLIDDWIAEGEAKGEARGRAEGEASGRAEAARRFALHLVERKFGAVPTALRMRIASADVAWCERLLDAVVAADNLASLPAEFSR